MSIHCLTFTNSEFYFLKVKNMQDFREYNTNIIQNRNTQIQSCMLTWLYKTPESPHYFRNIETNLVCNPKLYYDKR